MLAGYGRFPGGLCGQGVAGFEGVMRIFAKMKWGAVALLVLGGAAWAEGLPALPEEAHAIWAGVGRVNAGGYRSRGMCSGVLVARDRVLTAAHCLFRDDGRRVPLGDLHFVAGWHRGRAVADSGVVRAELHPKALREGRLDPARDVAVLVLETPLEIAPVPLMGRDLSGPPFAIVAYQGSRPHVMGGRFGCDLRLQKMSLAVSSCAVEPGASGGPVMGQVDGDWRVVGVVSARAGDWTLVARALDWVAEVVAAE